MSIIRLRRTVRHLHRLIVFLALVLGSLALAPHHPASAAPAAAPPAVVPDPRHSLDLTATVAISGVTWTHQSTITNTILAGFFGASLALSGTTAVIGAPALQGGPPAVGVYVRGGAEWTQQARLSGGSRAAWFGAAVALSGDTALVGAPQQDNVTGAAYVFVRHGTTWALQAEFTDPAPAAFSDDFGFSVALSGDTALVTAPGKNNGAGRAYVYIRQGTTWSQQAVLAAPDGAAQDDFGYAVALSGDTAVVGAPLKSSSLGAAYVFMRSGTTWTAQPLLTANDGGRQDQFGWAVALSGDTALIGANYEGNDQGAAYVFVRSGTTWSQQALLGERHGMYGDFFGSAVALQGNTALIATNLNRTTGPEVVVYERSG